MTSNSSDARARSSYYDGMELEAKKRYDAKIIVFGSLGDPYCVQKKSLTSVEWQNWPSVEYPDVYNYLITTPSLYTKDKLKAYKSLEAYKYFVSGWVSNVTVHVVPSGARADYLVMARVKHSQKLSAPSLNPWIALDKSGTVICAHCTCMAGLGEVCSHIAAVLFLMEANTNMKTRTSCTSLPCYWLPPTMQNVPFAPIAEIDFATPARKRQKILEGISLRVVGRMTAKTLLVTTTWMYVHVAYLLTHRIPILVLPQMELLPVLVVLVWVH